MYTATDLLSVMKEQGGSSGSSMSVQLGTMTGYNTCSIGDQITLAASQLLFFERDTYRMARTVRPIIKGHVSQIPTDDDPYIALENESDDWDRSVYDKPYESGDTVALLRMSSAQYLVLGKVISGSDVTQLDDQTDSDWALSDDGGET